MINQSIPEWFREECDKMRPMSWRQRFDYFWTYYKIHTFVVIGVILLISGYISAQIYSNKEVLISGIFLNTDTSSEGYDYLSEGYWQHCGGNQNQRVDIIETLVIGFSQSATQHENGNLITQVDALIATRSLDYMILDEAALHFYAPQELCMDLTQVLTNAQMELLSDRLVTSFGLENQQEYCAAIDVTGSAFAQRFGLTREPSYLVIVCNTPHSEAVPAFVNYLFGF